MGRNFSLEELQDYLAAPPQPEVIRFKMNHTYKLRGGGHVTVSQIIPGDTFPIRGKAFFDDGNSFEGKWPASGKIMPQMDGSTDIILTPSDFDEGFRTLPPRDPSYSRGGNRFFFPWNRKIAKLEEELAWAHQRIYHLEEWARRQR